jgi:RNA polymerase sigma-54 factor
MAFQGFQQAQKQTQSLVLAPQLRQSLKILQAPTLELRSLVVQELQTNPTLEELPMDDVSLEQPVAESEDSGDSETEYESEDSLEFNDDFSILRKMSEDFRENMAQETGEREYTSDDAARRQHFFDSLTGTTSLQEELMEQARLAESDQGILQALEYLIGSLDNRGFLTVSMPDIALMTNLPLKKVQQAATLLKTFDPPGIGAENMRECLLMQLRAKGQQDSVAASIIRDHFDLLMRRRIPELARKVGVPPDLIEEALEVIASLDPAPGRKFQEDTNRVVEPDVRVEKDSYGEWVIHLNNDYIPRLRISSLYKEMLAKGVLRGKDREYVRDQVRNGKFLISSIEQRQQTIERITRAILTFQADFFENGVSRLHPLTMNQVAETVGVHETTVSRAIANKYIDTPHGVFELKYFFTTGYTGESGETVSNTSIKERIARLVADEPTSKPFSDQAIAEILKEEGITIARRTVAKYREELGILPTNLRRQYS